MSVQIGTKLHNHQEERDSSGLHVWLSLTEASNYRDDQWWQGLFDCILPEITKYEHKNCDCIYYCGKNPKQEASLILWAIVTGPHTPAVFILGERVRVCSLSTVRHREHHTEANLSLLWDCNPPPPANIWLHKLQEKMGGRQQLLW